MLLTTPVAIGETVRKLQAKLGLDKEPAFVPVRDTGGSFLNDSRSNVARKVASAGGASVDGWIIWETPGKLIEGEFSAVWMSPEGELVDITPHADGETLILFIPDPRPIEAEVTVKNVRITLSDDPAVHELIRAAKEVEQQMTMLSAKFRDVTKSPRVPVVQPPSRGSASPDRNAPCPCGSGLKFKRCHGAPPNAAPDA